MVLSIFVHVSNTATKHGTAIMPNARQSCRTHAIKAAFSTIYCTAYTMCNGYMSYACHIVHFSPFLLGCVLCVLLIWGPGPRCLPHNAIKVLALAAYLIGSITRCAYPFILSGGGKIRDTIISQRFKRVRCGLFQDATPLPEMAKPDHGM